MSGDTNGIDDVFPRDLQTGITTRVNEADPFNDAVSAISSDYTDSTSQADPVVGTYVLRGLTPGADYRAAAAELARGPPTAARARIAVVGAEECI